MSLTEAGPRARWPMWMLAQASLNAGLGALRGDGEGLNGGRFASARRMAAPISSCRRFAVDITKDLSRVGHSNCGACRGCSTSHGARRIWPLGSANPRRGASWSNALLTTGCISRPRRSAVAEASKSQSVINDLRGLPTVGYVQDMIFDKELDYLEPLGSAAACSWRPIPSRSR